MKCSFWCLLHVVFLHGLHFSSEDRGRMLPRNIGWILPDYLALNPKCMECIINTDIAFSNTLNALCTVQESSKFIDTGTLRTIFTYIKACPMHIWNYFTWMYKAVWIEPCRTGGCYSLLSREETHMKATSGVITKRLWNICSRKKYTLFVSVRCLNVQRWTKILHTITGRSIKQRNWLQ
jgi:hypothetical protein